MDSHFINWQFTSRLQNCLQLTDIITSRLQNFRHDPKDPSVRALVVLHQLSLLAVSTTGLRGSSDLSAIRQFGYTAIRLYGCTVVRLYGCMAIRPSGYLVIQVFGYMPALFGHSAIQLCCYAAIRLFGNSAVRILGCWPIWLMQASSAYNWAPKLRTHMGASIIQNIQVSERCCTSRSFQADSTIRLCGRHLFGYLAVQLFGILLLTCLHPHATSILLLTCLHEYEFMFMRLAKNAQSCFWKPIPERTSDAPLQMRSNCRLVK